MNRRSGFTLVELMVVLSIIAIIIVMVTPSMQRTVTRAKDSAVKSNCSAIEAGLATFAARNGGSYPGLAIDVMAPFGDNFQTLGDPQLTGSVHPQYANWGSYGITGDYGHRNYASTQTVHQQLAARESTTLTPGNIATPRYFDTLIATDSLQEYPSNAFSGSLMTRSNRMKNIFGIFTNVTNLTDLTNAAQMNSLAFDEPWLNCTTQGNLSGKPGVYFFKYESGEFSWNVGQLPVPLPIDPSTFNPEQFSANCAFGTDANDYFAEGNFAYVPVLSASVFPLGDDPTTLRNEKFMWGSRVTAYMLFGYGSRTNKNDLYRTDQLNYVATGLPGYGGAGVDTRYEALVLQLFEGAVYFNKVGL